MWEKGKNVHSIISEHCVTKGKTPVYFSLTRNTSSCVSQQDFAQYLSPHRTLLFHEHEGNMPPHLTAPLCFQPGSSIPLGAVRVGCSGCFRHSSPLPQLMCVPGCRHSSCALELPSLHCPQQPAAPRAAGTQLLANPKFWG